MNFRIGQLVYVGFADKLAIVGNRRKHTCRVATIDGGPFEAGEVLPNFRAWHVDSGATVAENILFPFEPPDETTDTTERKSITA